MITQTVKISGMHCDACAKLVARYFSRIPGVTVEHVENGLARVTADSVKPAADYQHSLSGTEYKITEVL